VHVLLVEDAFLARKLLEYLFDKLGCVCDSADSAEEAFELFVDKHYDVVFADIGLPRMSDIDLAKRM
jgi:two-component system aerobic respiration control sensor histidine kinase ArcB